MKECIAIRHVAFEHLGTLAPLLENKGFHIRYLDVGVTDLSYLNQKIPDLLVILGGPVGAYQDNIYPWLAEELRLIERRLITKRPILGICLGAQLMAKALGSRVYPGRDKEIGWHPLQLTPEGENSCLAGLQSCEYQVLHWHGDTFDLPTDAQRLAFTKITNNQAFSYGANALGLQFHLEIDVVEIERWLIGHAHEIAATHGVTPSILREESIRYGKALATSATGCISTWIDSVLV